MRIHSLRMRAFGPFSDETTIDFDDVSADGLFLLHGPTGAGKTTILDAIAFALYGRVPGARNDAKRLHSDHAAPEAVPEVSLEATIGGRRLRLTRSPEFHRPKSRGVGTRKINASATLTWLDGSGVNLTRIPEIGDAVIELLGMSAEQFFQVVLLPQGDFARFLRANPDERESLLERVFDTDRFGGVEEWLRDRARVSAADLAEQEESLERLARQVVAVGGAEPPAEPDFDWANGCLVVARAAVGSAAERRSATQDAADKARTAFESGQRLAELRRRGTQAQARIDELDSGRAELDTARTRLDAARRAAPIAPVLADRRVRVDEVERADRARREAEQALAELPDGAELCVDPTTQAVAAAIGRWSAESGRLEPLAQRAAGREAIVIEINDLHCRIVETDALINRLKEAVAQAPSRRDAVAEELRVATESATILGSLIAERDRVAAVARAIAERDTEAARLTEAVALHNAAHNQHNTAREQLITLREKRIAGMAAELAGRLVDGEACGVCGSTEHPQPAVGDVSAVSDKDEAAAVKAERVAGKARDEAAAALSTIEKRVAALDTVIGEATAADIERLRAESVDAVRQAERAAKRRPELERALAALDREVEKWRADLGEKQTAQAVARDRVTMLRSELGVLDADIAEVTGGRFTVTDRRAELDRLCRLAAVLRDALETQTRARTHLDDVDRTLTDLCAEAGFDDLDAASEAMASPDQIATLEKSLTDADRIRAAAEDTLSDNDVRAAMADAEPDLDSLTEVLRTAQEARDTAAAEHAVTGKALLGMERFVTQFGEEFEALAPARARHAELQGLAELVSGRGQNSRRMSLRSYVLAARLEEVLVAASVRLQQMSSGRYEFVHSDAAGPRGRRGGLGIEVRDEYTGTTRATTTLSGGETFFASLALALGLADVVSAESGGRVLDTIFIDEGFGTLDPEALDLVMGVLDELRSGGRVVGVVSHVDELRARIPSQLHVLRGENGSRVRALGAVGAG